jgi:hypothetical protein
MGEIASHIPSIPQLVTFGHNSAREVGMFVCEIGNLIGEEDVVDVFVAEIV